MEAAKTEKLKVSFSKRLTHSMLDRGYKSPKDQKKANTQRLADATGVSRQMAARYLNGDAFPDTQVLRSIADWLQCDPWWLLYGKKKDHQECAHKISADLFKFIVCEMRATITKRASNALDYSYLFDSVIEIYNNIIEIEGEIEVKKNSAMIMINFIKNQYS